MSGTPFPFADFERMGWSHRMIEYMRWLGEGVCASTGAQFGDYTMFADQEPLGQSFDYQAPAGAGGADTAGIADAAVTLGTIKRLQDDVQGLCSMVDEKDQELMALRTRIRALECMTEGVG